MSMAVGGPNTSQYFYGGNAPGKRNAPAVAVTGSPSIPQQPVQNPTGGPSQYPGAQYGSVTTSTTPQGIYSPTQTNYATNQEVSRQKGMADMRFNLKGFDRPGVSRSAGSVAAALPGVMAGNLGAANAQVMQPMQDAFANQSNVLQGETNRETEGLGWSNLLQRLSELGMNQQQGTQNQLPSLLSKLMGG